MTRLREHGENLWNLLAMKLWDEVKGMKLSKGRKRTEEDDRRSKKEGELEKNRLGGAHHTTSISHW